MKRVLVLGVGRSITKISASWPDSMDDSCARAEWGWNPKWGINEMIDDMLRACKTKIESGEY